jgi:hypothetical protein
MPVMKKVASNDGPPLLKIYYDLGILNFVLILISSFTMVSIQHVSAIQPSSGIHICYVIKRIELLSI